MWHRREGGLYRLWEPACGISGWKHICQRLGAQNPLSGLKTMDWLRSCKKSRLQSWGAHTHLLTTQMHWRTRFKLPRTLAGFPQSFQHAPQPESRAKVTTTKKRMHLRATKPVGTQHSTWVGQGQLFLEHMKAVESGLVWKSNWHAGTTP